MCKFECNGCKLGGVLMAITTATEVAAIDNNSAIGPPGVESIEWNEIAGLFYSNISAAKVLVVMVL